jgi:hypothetical protein
MHDKCVLILRQDNVPIRIQIYYEMGRFEEIKNETNTQENEYLGNS